MRKLIGTATDLRGVKVDVHQDGDEISLTIGGTVLTFCQPYWDFAEHEQGPGGIEQLTDLLEEASEE